MTARDEDLTGAEAIAAVHARARRPPPRQVLSAFGLAADLLKRLPGGQQTTWTDGRIVVKRVGCEPEHAWVCEVFANWTAADRVRVPAPIRPRPADERRPRERWTLDGWGAHVFVPGRDAELLAEIEVVREASDLFHEAVAPLARPGFLDERTDPWAFGDRLAWEGAEPQGSARTRALVARLRAAVGAADGAGGQVVHGDILPNVLVADGRPPAVIDWPSYYRPAGFARAIAITDAITFRGAPMDLLDAWATGPDWDELLIRAVLYRLGPTGYFEARDRLMGSLVTHVERADPIANHLLARLGRS